MAQASRSVVIDVTPEKFFAVLTDYEKYPEFLPEVKKVQMAFGSGNIREVTYTVDVKAKVITYTLRHTAQPNQKLTWQMIKGDPMLKGNDGSWELKALEGGKTEAKYSVDLKLSSLVPSFIEKALAEQSLPGMLANFKSRAEKLSGGAA